ncbi:small cardioactive peptides-like [Gigantopelta aegis]|uniref:small cardioactive peptides-like n=1 Tax=Gigantopelta aegis TaxID=1735272 RepID=UPI001B88D05F|nr:small cardioactive peptides-like [Gigantopelta aegis]
MDVSLLRIFVVVFVCLAMGCEAMNFLAYPRLGRSSYLAFPRLGRAHVSAAGSDCCQVGLKNEWLDENDKSEMHNICQSDVCCFGLKEIVKRKPNGVYYSMCIPTGSHQEISKNVIGKLKELLRK